ELDVVMALLDRSLGRLAHQRKGLRDHGVERLSLLDPKPQRMAALGELLVAFTLEHRLQGIDGFGHQGKPAETTPWGGSRRPLPAIQPHCAKSPPHASALPTMPVPGSLPRSTMIPGALTLTGQPEPRFSRFHRKVRQRYLSPSPSSAMTTPCFLNAR